MAKVSIVLPSYNGEKYIRESIQSVLNQTFKDWELIIVNDCSEDSTLEIARGYEMMDKRVRVVSNEENKKLPASLNVGFRMATGKYLTWTSDDNCYLPDAIEEMVCFLDNEPTCYLVSAMMEMMDADGEYICKWIPYEDDVIYIRDQVGACFLYRREVLDTIGEYDVTRFLVEDYDYWLRIRNECGEIKLLPKVLYRYRQHGESLTATKSLQICYQRAKLRVQYQDKLIEQCKNRSEFFYEVYYDFLRSGFEDEAFIKRIRDLIPMVKYESMDFLTNKPFIIFGAGFFGNKAVGLLKDKAIGITDNNQDLIGSTRYGLPIISFEELLERKDDVNVCICLDVLHVKEVMEQLIVNGITRFWTYHGLVINLERARGTDGDCK